MATTVITKSSIISNAAISASNTVASGASATLYTAPATGFAIIQVGIATSGSTGQGVVVVGGQRIAPPAATGNFFNIHVGPSQTVVITETAGAGAGFQANISGVEFINS